MEHHGVRELEMHKRCATRRRRDLLYAGFNLLVLVLVLALLLSRLALGWL